MNKIRLLLSFFVLLTSIDVSALTIVRMEMQLATVVANVDMELYDEDTPLAVTNFLGYVNRGDYDNLLFNRSLAGFVVQGGGYSYQPIIDFDARFVQTFGATHLTVYGDLLTGELGLAPIDELYLVDANNDDVEDLDPLTGQVLLRQNSSLQQIPIDQTLLPVLNEPGISNLRGTLAMAKFSSDPNSAANEWFVNLADNSGGLPSLDTQNGGFTVFGSIMGSGMDYFDAVSNQSLHIFAESVLGSSDFRSLPVINGDGTLHDGMGAVMNENLAKVNYASEILHIDVSNVNFGVVGIGFGVQKTITLTNRWSNSITIGKFGDLDALAAPYVVISDTCTGVVIQQLGTCNVVIELNSATQGVFTDSVDLSFVTPDISNITIDLSAVAPSGIDQDIIVNGVVDFGAVTEGSNVLTELLVVTNIGQNPLTITSIVGPSGVDFVNFQSQNDCLSLALGASCTITLVFDPNAAGFGDKTAQLTINSDDPVSPSVVVDLLGSVLTLVDSDGDGVNDGVDAFPDNVAASVDVDNDGLPDEWNAACSLLCQIGSGLTLDTLLGDGDNDSVLDVIENAIANGGDGNNDNVLDSTQVTVASLQLADGSYATLALDNTGFNSSLSNVRQIFNPSPSDAPNVLFSSGFIKFDVATQVSAIDVVLILPVGSNVETYYQYGVTPDNDTPHWYEFMFDGETGASILENMTFTAPDMTTIKRDIILIRYQDGLRGDNDLLVNGFITSEGAVGRKIISSDDGGGGQIGFLMTLIMMLSLCGFRLRSNY